MVLWVLVVGGALLSVAAVLAVHEHRASEAARRHRRALAEADAGLVAARSGWTPAALRRALPLPFDSLLLDGGGNAPWQGTLRRLSSGLFLLEVSAGVAPGNSLPPLVAAEVRVGWVLEPRPLAFAATAAMSVGDSATIEDRTLVSGREAAPPEACPPADSGVGGLAAAAVVQAPGAVVDGTPAVVLRPTSDSRLAIDDLSAFERLSGSATVRLTRGAWGTNPRSVGTACDTQDPFNWGDPWGTGNPCSDYRPIIRVDGDLTLTGGGGQGILLVDGNLSIVRAYGFHGLIITTGRLMIALDSGIVNVAGAVAGADVRAQPGPMASVEVRYSKCLILKALLDNAPLVPVRSRGWRQLY